MNMMEKKQPPSPDREREIVDYLRENPDFFSRHKAVLETLYLPHASGAAVSLVEKQLRVLRERNTELRARLSNLLELSKANDLLFARSRDLVLKLMDAADAPAVVRTLLTGFTDDFEIEFSSLTLLDSELAAPGLNHLSLETAREKVSAVVDSDEPLCGVLRSQELIALFGDSATPIGSAVAMRLAVGNRPYGILALGNRNSHHYSREMDTLFLRFIADMLDKLLYPKL